MIAENECRQQKEKTVENKMSGESYVKNIICKAQFKKKHLTFNKNWSKVDRRLLNGSFDKRSNVVAGWMTSKKKMTSD